MTDYFLGVDVGSVSTNLVLLDQENKVHEKIYMRTMGNPIQALKAGMMNLKEMMPEYVKIKAVGTTGSGRELAAVILGADVVKNEITAHGVAAMEQIDHVRTILEIGGQDSKIIIIKDGIITDFAMNTVCAAGTGSFLDRQAARLGIEIEQFGECALKSKNPVRIAGRCAVFAESDMIHKQQLGCNQEDIIYGLCEALVRNYLSNVGKGKPIEDNVVFQGGVAANTGIRRSFEKALKTHIFIPDHFDVMGAIGAAILAKDEIQKTGFTHFRGFDITEDSYQAKGLECEGCPNLCEIVEIWGGDKILARWGDRCGKWSHKLESRRKDKNTG